MTFGNITIGIIYLEYYNATQIP